MSDSIVRDVPVPPVVRPDGVETRPEFRGDSLGDIRGFILRHRWLLVAALLGSVGLVGAYTALVGPRYEGTAQLRIEAQEMNLPELLRRISQDNQVGTELEMLRSRALAAEVVDSLGLRLQVAAPRRTPRHELFARVLVTTADTLRLELDQESRDEFAVHRLPEGTLLDVARIGEWTTVAGVSFVLAPGASRFDRIELRVVSPEVAIEGLQDALKIDRVGREADMLVVRYRDSDPALARDVPNQLLAGFIAGRQAAHRALASDAVQFLRRQLDTVRTQLISTETALEQYRTATQSVALDEEARTKVGRLVTAEAERAQVAAEREALETLVDEVRAQPAAAGTASPYRRVLAFPTLLRNETASELLRMIATAEDQRAVLLQRRTDRDPDVITLTNRIAEIDRQLQAIAETYLQGLSNQVASLDRVQWRYRAELSRIPERELQLARLEREPTVLREIFSMLTTRLKEAEIAEAVRDPSVRVVDPAVVPEKPVSPRPMINLAASLVLGVMVGAGLGLVRDLGDRSVHSRRDVNQLTGLTVLGVVPRLRAGRSERGKRGALPARASRRWRRGLPPAPVAGGSALSRLLRPGTGRAGAALERMLITRPGASGSAVEAYRTALVNLAFASRGGTIKTLVIASPLPGEGKTLTALNLALTAARRGDRVLLIDADLRCGLVNVALGLPREPGFSQVLGGTAQLERAVRLVQLKDEARLHVLPSGAPLADPGRPLSSMALGNLLARVSAEYDLVIVDAPPVNLLADAALLGSAADGVILVARAGVTEMAALHHAVEQLAAARALVVGVILNDIDVRRDAGYDAAYAYLDHPQYQSTTV